MIREAHELSDITEGIQEKREECELSCADLWVSQKVCRERMCGVQKNVSTAWEIAKVFVIPLLTAGILYFGAFRALETKVASMDSLMNQILALHLTGNGLKK